MKKQIAVNGHILDLLGGRTQEIKFNASGNPYVNHRGKRYLLSEFLDCHNTTWNYGNPWRELGFDGYMSDSFFSGLLIKFDDETCKVYTYIG